MAGETLPPVVAVLQGDISDLVTKVAAAAKEVESLDDVTGTATADLDFAPLTPASKSSLASSICSSIVSVRCNSNSASTLQSSSWS